MLKAKGVEVGEPTLEKLNELLAKHPGEVVVLAEKKEVQTSCHFTSGTYADRTNAYVGIVSGLIRPVGSDKKEFELPFSGRHVYIEVIGSYGEDVQLKKSNPRLYQFNLFTFLTDLGLKIGILKESDLGSSFSRQNAKYDLLIGEEEISAWFKKESLLSDLDFRLFKATNILGKPMKVDSPFLKEKLKKREAELTEKLKNLYELGAKTEREIGSLKRDLAELGLKQ